MNINYIINAIMDLDEIFTLITNDGKADRLLMEEGILREQYLKEKPDNPFRLIAIIKRFDLLDEQLKYDLLDKQAMIESIMGFLIIKDQYTRCHCTICQNSFNDLDSE